MTQSGSWKDAKAQHKALSAAAADTYDDDYEKANFATGLYMRREARIIASLASCATNRDLAIDLGCGTGRAAKVLGAHFARVRGFDNSEEMIRAARAATTHPDITYQTLDVDDDALDVTDESVAFANAGFGMGSFVADIDEFAAKVSRALCHSGFAVFSFYNARSSASRLALPWSPSLAAHMQPCGTRALVTHPSGGSHVINAKSYEAHDLRQRLGHIFFDVEIETFPTVTALLPKTALVDEEAQRLACQIDELVAGQAHIAQGHYIIAICRKGQLLPRRLAWEAAAVNAPMPPPVQPVHQSITTTPRQKGWMS